MYSPGKESVVYEIKRHVLWHNWTLLLVQLTEDHTETYFPTVPSGQCQQKSKKKMSDLVCWTVTILPPTTTHLIAVVVSELRSPFMSKLMAVMTMVWFGHESKGSNHWEPKHGITWRHLKKVLVCAKVLEKSSFSCSFCTRTIEYLPRYKLKWKCIAFQYKNCSEETELGSNETWKRQQKLLPQKVVRQKALSIDLHVMANATVIRATVGGTKGVHCRCLWLEMGIKRRQANCEESFEILFSNGSDFCDFVLRSNHSYSSRPHRHWWSRCPRRRSCWTRV